MAGYLTEEPSTDASAGADVSDVDVGSVGTGEGLASDCTGCCTEAGAGTD